MSRQLPLWLAEVQQQRAQEGAAQAQSTQQAKPQPRRTQAAQMSKTVGQQQAKPSQQQAIDVLLADQPEAFKRTVFELCRQLGWPDDEPGFLLAIATNRLYALAQEYPQLLSEAMQSATKGAFEQWQGVQTKLDVAAVKQDTALGQLSSQLLKVQAATLDQVQHLRSVFKDERQAMLKALAQERSQVTALLETERQAVAQERVALQQLLEQERLAMVEAAQQQAEEQKAVLEKKASVVLATVVERAQQGMDKEVQRLLKVMRPKHYAEAAVYGCLAVALVSSASWMIAWRARGIAEEATVWGDIERWNRDHIQACIEAQQTTCSIHIEVPEHPVER